MLVKPLVRPICRAIAGSPTASLGSGFAPTSLFADGSIGVLYDNNDLTSFYLDAAGTTAATVNGLVGLQLDKSQGLVLGAEKNSDVGFDSPASWATPAETSVSGGLLNFTATTATRQPVTTNGASAPTAGRWYEVTYTVTSISSGSVFIVYGGTLGVTRTSAGTYREYLLAINSTTLITPTASTGTTASIDNLSIKELPGNHRYQSTTGFKPVLRGTPTGSELFAAYGTPGAGWSVAGATGTATTASSALPTTTASVVGKFYRVTYTVTRSAGSVQLSFGGRTGVSRSTAGQYVEYFDNTTNTNVLTATGTSFTGTVRIDEVKDVSAGSVTAPYGLQYDGVDDFLQTASVNFSATDKMFVCAGVRKFSNTVQVVLEQSANVDNFDNAFNFAVNALAGTNWYVSSGSTVQGQISARESTASAPVLGVVSSAFNRGVTGTGQISLRVNGLAGSPTYVGTGSTGNFRNDILYFGRRGGTSLPFNGLDFGFCIVGKIPSASQISNTERWFAQRTGVTL